ncbi:MAG: hypothetical protein ABR575_05175 [Actinomycetota bacterium]
MPRAKALFDEVRAAQEMFGRGETTEGFARAAALREEAGALLQEGRSLTSFERTHLEAAVTYTTVTLVLGWAEDHPPAESIPAIRQLAQEAVAAHRPGRETWKVLAAAAEMLARAGDAPGAVWAVRAGRALGSADDYLVKLSGSIQSMYPQVYAESPEEPGPRPPPIPGA